MAYSAFRDDRAAKKKNDSKNTVKLQVSILNFELYFIFFKTAFDCSLKLTKKNHKTWLSDKTETIANSFAVSQESISQW